MIKVSVVVPVYNPGDHMDDCIRTLVDQSLPHDEYEVIFVDDGSTDATPARLDRLADEHDHVRVEHIPNSGWPSRPRNVGIGMARGEFVYFVDNDDWLEHDALERLHARAVADDADVVIGKVIGHGGSKHVPHVVFKKDRTRVSLEQWTGMLWLLSPHKLFRKSLLDEHDIRFPEGKVRLEDHVFVMRAYFAAGDRISVLANAPIYHWMLRDDDSNASRTFDSVTYYDSVRRVLDVIDEHTEPGAFRDRLYLRWYRGKILGRVGGHPLLRYEGEQRRSRYEEARKVALERFGAHLDDLVPLTMRLRAHLMREGRFDDLVALAEREVKLGAGARISGLRADGDGMAFRFTAGYRASDDLLTFERDGDRLRWIPPDGIAPLPDAAQGDPLAKAEAYVYARSIANRSEFPVPVETELTLEEIPDTPGRLRPVFRGTGRLSASTGAAGAPLGEGDWQLLCEVRIAGLRVNTFLRPASRADAVTLHVAKGRVTVGKPTVARRMVGAFPGLASRAVRLRRRLRNARRRLRG